MDEVDLSKPIVPCHTSGDTYFMKFLIGMSVFIIIVIIVGIYTSSGPQLNKPALTNTTPITDSFASLSHIIPTYMPSTTTKPSKIVP